MVFGRICHNNATACACITSLAILLLCAASALAGTPPVHIERGWIRVVPPSSSDTVAYMTLVNDSGEPLRLSGGSTPIAKMVVPMMTTRKTVDGAEVMGMKKVNSLQIPAHGRLTLSPDGDHLMLMQMTTHPKPGDKARLTLRFEPGDQIVDCELPVALTQP